MFKLDSLALKTDTTFVQLRHPASGVDLETDDGKAVGISIYGSASKQYRNYITGMQNRAMQARKKNKDVTADEARKEALGLLVAISAGSSNLEYEGEAVDSPEMFKKLYADDRFSWLRDQVEEALGEAANFLEM